MTGEEVRERGDAGACTLVPADQPASQGTPFPWLVTRAQTTCPIMFLPPLGREEIMDSHV